MALTRVCQRALTLACWLLLTIICVSAEQSLLTLSISIESVSPNNGTAAGGTTVVINTVGDTLPSVTSVTLAGVAAAVLSQTGTSVTVRTGSGAGTCTGDVVVATTEATLTRANAFTIDAIPIVPCRCRPLPIEFTGMWSQLRTTVSLTPTMKAEFIKQLATLLRVDDSQVMNFNNTEDSSLVDYKFIPSPLEPSPSTERLATDMYNDLTYMIRSRSSSILHSNLTSLIDLSYLPRPIPVRPCADNSYSQPCPPGPPGKNGQMDGFYNGMMIGFTIGLVISSYGIHYYFNTHKRRHKANLAAFMQRDPEAL